MSKPKCLVLVVRLRDDQWGNLVMNEAARQTFAAHPEANAVRVVEHAGWQLTYNREMCVVGTANDAADMRGTQAWCDQWGGYEYRSVNLPDSELAQLLR